MASLRYLRQEVDPGHGGLRSQLKDGRPLEVDVHQRDVLLVSVVA
jgi:hypothetical protein